MNREHRHAGAPSCELCRDSNQSIQPHLFTCMNTSLILKRLSAVLCVVFVSAFLMGCKNTAEGFGEDVEKAGEKIQEKVD